MAEDIFFRMTDIDKIYPLEGEDVHALLLSAGQLIRHVVHPV